MTDKELCETYCEAIKRMSNSELVSHIREYDFFYMQDLMDSCSEAADRIEQLEAENKKLRELIAALTKRASGVLERLEAKPDRHGIAFTMKLGDVRAARKALEGE